MSINTLIEIGSAFRKAGRHQYHRFIKNPRVDKKSTIKYLSIPVLADFTIDIDNITDYPENQTEKLFYLTFKTSDKDSSIKYIFGDIFYKRDSKGKEGGNYRTPKYSGFSAFERGYTYIEDSKSREIKEFAKSFQNTQSKIEDILLENEIVFLHFDFHSNLKNWYDEITLKEINRLIIENFTTEQTGDNYQGYVFDSILLRTLCSGDDKNDIQFPGFSNKNKYKSRVFSIEEIENLFYAIDFSEKPTISAYSFSVGAASDKIKLVVLPRGKNLTAHDYENYSISREDIIRVSNQENTQSELLFASVVDETPNDISFDLLFVKEGQNVDTDIVEISNIHKSFLNDLYNRIRQVKIKIEDNFNQKLNIISAFHNILGDSTKSNKKYQAHLYKVLPQIYSGTYYQDTLLLPSLIEKVEQNIHDSERQNLSFYLLKPSYYFLLSIQNTSIEGKNLMKILQSQSYQIGLALGRLARPFGWKSTPIKSFEKNYVGNLMRRIPTIYDTIKLSDEIIQKITMHRDDVGHALKFLPDFNSAIKEFEGTYDKYECAFGFFEGYFSQSNKESLETEASN